MLATAAAALAVMMAQTNVPTGPAVYISQRTEEADHLLPGWRAPLHRLSDYHEFVATVLDLPFESWKVPGEDWLTHSWLLTFPPDGPETGISVIADRREGRWFARGIRSAEQIWLAYQDRVLNDAADLPAAAYYGVLADIGGAVRPDGCEVDLPGLVAIRYVDAVNARLVRTRPDAVIFEGTRPPPPPSDNRFYMSYWFGGAAKGMTGGRAGNTDMKALRDAGDAMIAHCFSPNPANLAALGEAVDALEASEPR